MRVTLHHSEDLERLHQYSRQQHDAVQRDRYRAVILAIGGCEAPEIARTLDRSRRFVQRWVYYYRDHGLDGLGPTPQPGRPSKLPPPQYEAFKTRFLAEPTPADGVCTLRAKEAQQILSQEFGVAYTLGGIYDLLHRLGLSCLVPRPRHPKNDPAQMQQWRDDAPLLSRRRRKTIRTDGSSSGSRTKPASDSKGLSLAAGD
jgi:transposase